MVKTDKCLSNRESRGSVLVILESFLTRHHAKALDILVLDDLMNFLKDIRGPPSSPASVSKLVFVIEKLVSFVHLQYSTLSKAHAHTRNTKIDIPVHRHRLGEDPPEGFVTQASNPTRLRSL